MNRTRDESGNMSIDFLVGFTIFLMAFIWVATMIPGILIGLQSYNIDYDAVAYRTGVLLVEDPGWPEIPGWETKIDARKANMTRFGLALSKETPTILSENKVNRFFNKTTFTYPDDYQMRVIFGDYPYKFNISLRDIERNETRVVGDILPDGYGHIRRLVKIKSMSNATIDAPYIIAHKYTNTENVTQHEFAIEVNYTKLLGDESDIRYQINPSTDSLMVNITDLHSTLPMIPDGVHNFPQQTNITLTKVFVYKKDLGATLPMGDLDKIYVDDNSSIAQLPLEAHDKVAVILTPDFVKSMNNLPTTKLYINFTFDLTTGGPTYDPSHTDYASPFLNNTNARAPAFDYNYNPKSVTQPRLRDGIVEVSVW